VASIGAPGAFDLGSSPGRAIGLII